MTKNSIDDLVKAVDSIKIFIWTSVGDPQEFAIADPCLYHFKYSPDVFQKKTKNLATYNTDKSCFDNFYLK